MQLSVRLSVSPFFQMTVDQPHQLQIWKRYVLGADSVESQWTLATADHAWVQASHLSSDIRPFRGKCWSTCTQNGQKRVACHNLLPLDKIVIFVSTVLIVWNHFTVDFTYPPSSVSRAGHSHNCPSFVPVGLSAACCSAIWSQRGARGWRLDPVLDRLLGVSGPREGPEALPGISRNLLSHRPLKGTTGTDLITQLRLKIELEAVFFLF